MPKQSKIDALVDYFKLCPLLKEGVMGVDYLEDKATAYSINPYLNSSPVNSMRYVRTKHQNNIGRNHICPTPLSTS